MKAVWGDSINQLKVVHEQFKNALIALPPNITYQNVVIPTNEVEKSIANLIAQMEFLETTEVDAVLFAVHVNGVTQQIPNIVSGITNYVTTAGSAPYGENLISYIWSCYASLTNVTFTDHKLAPLIKLATRDKTQISGLDKLNNAIIKSQEIINGYELELQKTKDNVKNVISSIDKMALEASNAKSNAESNVSQSATSKDKLDALLIQINKDKTESDTLLATLIAIKNQAEQTLASTSQVALAKSFNTRKVSLEESQKTWVLSFILGLVLLIAVTSTSLAFPDFFHIPAIIDANKHIDIWAGLLRLIIVGPFVWFTWFSVRQFGNNVALIEDYAFKEASALAFVGYKKDMEDDPEMVKLLRESAIRNFAYAPSRLISDSDAASPIHDLFERAFQDQGVFDRLISMINLRKGLIFFINFVKEGLCNKARRSHH